MKVQDLHRNSDSMLTHLQMSWIQTGNITCGTAFLFLVNSKHELLKQSCLTGPLFPSYSVNAAFICAESQFDNINYKMKQL